METEYILRDAAVEIALTYHEAHDITLVPGPYKDGFECGANLREQDITNGILTLSAADVRPVVYCRECEHSQDGFICDSPFHGGMTFPDDFCSRGIRREGGADG